jgi:hypothetical protein
LRCGSRPDTHVEWLSLEVHVSPAMTAASALATSTAMPSSRAITQPGAGRRPMC